MPESPALSLFDLNSRIRKTIENGLPELYWVTAEISEISLNFKSGHVYLELVEKDSAGDKMVARARATIWSALYRSIKPFFETTTGQSLQSGMKILVKVSVEFHEVYQFSLNIRDIDPSYTLGDLARQKQEVIRRLEETGVIDMNRKLPLPLVIQKIAVISSPSAAGYGDFMHQLQQNAGGYHFETVLFEALLQGNEAVASLLDALSRIAGSGINWDLVAVIRGGGSKLDLSCFDQFDLAYFAAQFPVPIVTGIGHERDDTVLDLVAHQRCKTPTAAAEWIIDVTQAFDQWLDDQGHLAADHALSGLRTAREGLERLFRNLPVRVHQRISASMMKLDVVAAQCRQIIPYQLREMGRRLTSLQKQADLLDPVHTLRRGYSILTVDGRSLRTTERLEPGTAIHIRLHQGELDGTVTRIYPRKKDLSSKEDTHDAQKP